MEWKRQGQTWMLLNCTALKVHALCSRTATIGCHPAKKGNAHDLAVDILLAEGLQETIRSDADIKGMPTQQQMKLMWHDWLHPAADNCRPHCGGQCHWGMRTFFINAAVHFKDHQ